MPCEIVKVHPENPQQRLIDKVTLALNDGKVIVLPLETGYALACRVGDKAAQQKMRIIRQLDDDHLFTLLCKDLSMLGTYAKVGNRNFRLLKQFTPGAYTFILEATKELPRKLCHPKRKTLGLRVSQHPVAQAVLETLGSPMLTSTLLLPGQWETLMHVEDIKSRLHRDVAVIVDAGVAEFGETSIIDLVNDVPLVVRVGLGDVSAFTRH